MLNYRYCMLCRVLWIFPINRQGCEIRVTFIWIRIRLCILMDLDPKILLRSASIVQICLWHLHYWPLRSCPNWLIFLGPGTATAIRRVWRGTTARSVTHRTTTLGTRSREDNPQIFHHLKMWSLCSLHPSPRFQIRTWRIFDFQLT